MGAPLTETTFTFRLDENLKSEFADAAKASDRTGAQLLRDFMGDFVKRQRDAVAHDVWFRRQVQSGIDAADAGDVVSAELVEADADVWRSETRRSFSPR